MIFLIKKILLIGIVLGIFAFLMIPSGAAPQDVVLDQQVGLMVPGKFELVDLNHDHLYEGINFQVEIQSYHESNFIVTGNLEGMKNGSWVSLNTTVIPFQWSPNNKTVLLNFKIDNIKKYKISGPFRVTMRLKDGNWELPEQVVGFSPKYTPDTFSIQSSNSQGTISTVAKARRAVETWAAYQSMKLGSFLGVSYNYDHWQVEYQEKSSPKIWQFVVSPEGSVQLLKINPNQS